MDKKCNRMEITRMKKYLVIVVVIVILFTCSPLALAQSPDDSHPQGIFFNLQFSLVVAWNGSQTETPILPGETREVNQTFTYTVNKGLLGNLLLQLLKGKSFLIQLSVEYKPDWCEAWYLPENMTGVVTPGEVGVQYSSLFIRLKENAPGNYTIGTIKIHGTIKDMKGPFHIITLIQGFKHDYQLNFQTGP